MKHNRRKAGCKTDEHIRESGPESEEKLRKDR